MYNDLIVMSFSRKEEALLAWIGLDMMRDRRLMGIEKALAISKDKVDRVVIHQSWELGAYSQTEELQVLYHLTEAMFGADGHAFQEQVSAAGLDPVFLKNVNTAFGSDSSALLFYVPHDSLTDIKRLLDILQQMRGTVYHTTFTTAVTEAILNQEYVV